MGPKANAKLKALTPTRQQRGPIDDVPLYTAFPHIEDVDGLMADLLAVVSSNVLTNIGPQVRRFEKSVLDYLGHRSAHAVSCTNATAGLELALRALGLKGKVIVTPFTFVATVNSIVNAGLEPVFADIDPVTLCLSPAAVEKARGPGVVAVMPVHVYGNVCDIYYFESLRKQGIKVVYDSAHAFGVEWNGIKAGKWGDAEVFSFHATKVLNACEGGAIVTQDPELAERALRMSNFGIVSETEVAMVGSNVKMSEVHAAFGLHSLKHLDAMIERRLGLCEAYRERLAGIPLVEPLPRQPGVRGNGQYFPVLLPDRTARDALFEALKEYQIVARRYFSPCVHQFKAYRGMKAPQVPVAESIAARILCLPLHAAMQVKHVDYVFDAIKRCLK